ncbi:hypothetical protein ACS0TY_027339 [Phlomoides rotata]
MSAFPEDDIPDFQVNNDSNEDDSDEEVINRFMFDVLIPNFCMRRERIPQNISRLSRNDYVGELLAGPDTRFYYNVRMNKPCFYALIEELLSRGVMSQDPRSRVSVIEKVIMFIRTVSMHHRQRDTMDRFQHSLETVNRSIHEVLNVLVSLALIFITHHNVSETPPQVLNVPRFYPYFEGAIGAKDGILIPAAVRADHQTAFRSRKGTISQNVLAICDFNLMFTYVYVGWEGSASDAHVLFNAIISDQHFPWLNEGKYYLVDAGFTNYTHFLAPYRQTRYHLNEFRSSGMEARTPAELFNHRHSSLRNAIERCFGVLKSRFPMLKWGMPSYTMDRQVKIVIACCVLHNFIRQFGMEDEIFEGNSEYNDNDEFIFSQSAQANQQSIEDQCLICDALANAM